MNISTTSNDQAMIRQGRRIWAILAGACVLGMVVLLPLTNSIQSSSTAWFIVPMLWLALAVPATVGLHGHCFRGEWSSRPEINIADYVRGATSIWLSLAVGVGLSLAACLATGSASPSIWPGALMLMLLVLAKPSSSGATD